MGQRGVSEWLAGQEVGPDGDDSVTTVDGESAEVDGLDTSSGVTTVPGEWGVVCVLQDVSEDSMATVEGEETVVQGLVASEVPPLPLACKTLAAVLKSISQREGRTVICFLDGTPLSPADYHAHLTCCHEALFRQIEVLPAHLKVALPHPPATPAPNESTPPQMIHQYNRESLQIFRTWLPIDVKRSNRAYPIRNALEYYSIPDVCYGFLDDFFFSELLR